MYLGPDRKLETLVAWALLDPVISQGTHWTSIDASWSEDGTVTITDDDLSFPLGTGKSGRSLIEERLTNLYVGDVPRGAMLCPVMALCDSFVVELHRAAGLYRLRFERGVPGQMETSVARAPWRTRVELRPDLQLVRGHLPLGSAALIREAETQLARAAAEPHRAVAGGTPITRVVFRAHPAGVTLERGA
jgi:DNA gyrase/topoisomerase IV subunit B